MPLVQVIIIKTARKIRNQLEQSSKKNWPVLPKEDFERHKTILQRSAINGYISFFIIH